MLMRCGQDKQVFVVSKQTNVPNCRCGGKVSRGRTSCRTERITLKIVKVILILPLFYFFSVRLGEFVGWVSSMQRPGTKLANQHG